MVRHTAVHVAALSLLLTLGLSAYSADFRGYALPALDQPGGGTAGTSSVWGGGASGDRERSTQEAGAEGRGVALPAGETTGIGGEEAGTATPGQAPSNLGLGTEGNVGVETATPRAAAEPAQGLGTAESRLPSAYGIDLRQPGGFTPLPVPDSLPAVGNRSILPAAPSAPSPAGQVPGGLPPLPPPTVGGERVNPVTHIAELNTRIAGLEGRIRDLEGKLTKAILQGAEAKEDLAKAKEEITRLRSELGEARTQSDAPRTGAGKAAAGLMDGIFGLFGF